MSRPMLLVFLLMILVITSQFEWRQPLVSETEAAPRQISSREEAVKEKIILSQERSIQKLNELVQSLRKQLSECRSNNTSANSSLSSLTERIIELERQHILEDKY